MNLATYNSLPPEVEAPSALSQRLAYEPALLATAEDALKEYFTPSDSMMPNTGDPESYGWSEPMMLPSPKKAAAALAVAAAAIPLAPRRKD
jgi:hypothetical protein